MTVAFDDMPAGRGIAAGNILAAGKAYRAVDRDLVVVPQNDQAAELQVPGEADRLMVDAFHQAAVAGNHPGVVIDQPVAETGIEVALGEREADRHRQPLAERAGGAFDAFDLEIFGVPSARAAELAEIADVVEGRLGIAGQM